ncbi:hypothetical protein QQ008_04650 [Fulvivirgaceae bacterium BMA10]|uniref:DUF6249 domain-containing protein n=1 Tax=Splendidivirga corallicola TaxID=3051826 RepID=A0ABT8KK69_9BACT|nr:hypothetical protein [Fulvivirgaceae bacterium BMA10]
MEDFLIPFSVLGTIAVGLYSIIKLITDYKLKKKMINKGYVDEENQELFKAQDDLPGRYSSLKWGLIILGAGTSLIILEYVPFRLEDSPLPFGMVALFISAGFLAYYSIVKNK